MKPIQKDVPFRIDRAQRANLADQISAGFERAIASGYYKAGERLPTVRELVRHFSVSSRDIVAAVAKLAGKGLVESVPHKGVTIRARSAMPVWKGHVLCVVASGDFSYGIISMVGRLRDRISKAGYLFTQVTTPRGEKGILDLSGLDYALNQPIDFAVLMSSDRRLVARLKKSGIPFVSESFPGAESVSSCQGVYCRDVSDAYLDFASLCRAEGVVRITVVAKDAREDGDWVAETFRKGGFDVEVVRLHVKRVGESRLEALRRAGHDAVCNGSLMPGPDMPRQLFFTDDYVASGAMMAFAEKGVRMPDQVRFATVVNVGNRPATGFPYVAFVSDPFGDGDQLSEAVLAHLEGHVCAYSLTLPLRLEA